MNSKCILYFHKFYSCIVFKTHFSNQINIFLIPAIPNAMKMYFAYKHIVTNGRLLRSENLKVKNFSHFFPYGITPQIYIQTFQQDEQVEVKKR